MATTTSELEQTLATMRAGRDCRCHDNHYCGCFERERKVEAELERRRAAAAEMTLDAALANMRKHQRQARQPSNDAQQRADHFNAAHAWRLAAQSGSPADYERAAEATAQIEAANG